MPECEEDLIKESENLDHFLKKRSFMRNLSKIMAIILILLYIVAFLTHFKNILLPIAVAVLVTLFLTQTFPVPLDQRKKISYSLSKISKALESGDKNIEQYVRFLYDEATSEILEDIEKEDLIFRDDLIKHNSFWKNLEEFALELNHAVSKDCLDRINSKLTFQLAIAVYYMKNNLVELSDTLAGQYQQKQQFPPFRKRLWKSKWAKSLLGELVISVFVGTVYAFFTIDIDTIFIGFCMLTAFFLSIVWKST